MTSTVFTGRNRKRFRRSKNRSFRGKILKCIENYGMNSENARVYFDNVCAKAKTFFSEEPDVWIGFEAGKENIPIIGAVVKERNFSTPTQVYNFQFLQRVKNEVSGEAMFCLEKESEMRFSKEEMNKLHACIVKHSPTLFKLHSNIQIISGSRIKCRGYSVTNEENTHIENTTCIVLYVHVKGIIPVNETVFPSEMDGFPVDVREGCFKTFMLQEGASDSPEYHRNLTMGCHIANSYKMSGSLGGFIQLPNKNIGCLTCWHLFETDQSRTDTEKDILAHKDFKRDVFQPGPALEHNFRFGEVIGGILREGNENEIGVDAALIEITEKHREPRNLCLYEGNNIIHCLCLNYSFISFVAV